MPQANLYVDDIAVDKHFPDPDCGQCAVGSCRAFAELLRDASAEPDGCPHLGPNEQHAFRVASRASDHFPPIEVTQHPMVGDVGLFELNEPGADAPLLVTGNAEQTILAVTAILSTTVLPMRVLFVDTRGDTVDMSIILGTLTPAGIAGALDVSRVGERMEGRSLMLPGMAAALADEVREESGWEVEVGPRCIGEVPLLFARRWAAPEPG